MGGGELLSAAARSANDQWDGTLAAKHGVDFRGMIDDLIHSQHDKIDGHDLDDGTQTKHGGPCGHADKAIFADGCIYNASGTELLQQTGRNFIGALKIADLLS